MGRGTIIRPSAVKPFKANEAYTSRMLLDNTNSEAEKIQINHGTLKAGKNLLPASAHGGPQDHYDETYIILKGKCRLQLDGEWFDIKAGDVIFIPGGVYHGLDNNEGTEDLEILAIWGNTPGRGVSDVYDKRIAAWGKSFKLINED